MLDCSSYSEEWNFTEVDPVPPSPHSPSIHQQTSVQLAWTGEHSMILSEPRVDLTDLAGGFSWSVGVTPSECPCRPAVADSGSLSLRWRGLRVLVCEADRRAVSGAALRRRPLLVLRVLRLGFRRRRLRGEAIGGLERVSSTMGVTPLSSSSTTCTEGALISARHGAGVAAIGSV